MAMLEVKDLQVYYGMIQAIKGISFEVNQGEVIALIGANGAGKTTILHTVSGLLAPKKKEVLSLKVRTSQRFLHIKSYPWGWLMYRKDVVCLRSFPYMTT